MFKKQSHFFLATAGPFKLPHMAVSNLVSWKWHLNWFLC